MSWDSLPAWKSMENCCCSHNGAGNRGEDPANSQTLPAQEHCSGAGLDSAGDLEQPKPAAPTGPRAIVYGKTSHGRRRSESAPDALLDCLHCGKDLASPRLDEPLPKRSHTRNYTTAASVGLGGSPVRATSSRRTSFSRKQKGGDAGCSKHGVCSQCCLCGRRKTNPARSDRTRRRPSTNRYFGKQPSTRDKLFSFHFTEDAAGQSDSFLESPVKKTALRRIGDGLSERPDKHLRKYSTQKYAEKHVTTDPSADDFLGRDDFPPRRHRSVDFEHTVRDCNADYEDDTANDDDTELGFVNVNENRRRKSLTSVADRLGAGRRWTADGKRKRWSYPGYATKRRPSPDREGSLAESLRERLSLRCSHNHAANTYSDKRGAATAGSERRLEREKAARRQQLTTSEDDDGNGEDSESVVDDEGPPGRRSSLLMMNLSDMWRRRRLCDAILRSNGQEIAAHKLALAAFSDTFARRYCEGEGLREMPAVVDIPDTSAGGIQEVLRFVYTGDIRITSDNVAHVLAAAAFLHIKLIVNMCKEMLLNPDVETVVFFSYLAEKYHISDNLAFFYDFMCQHFLRVSRTRGWRTLTFGQVFDLLSEDNLNVERELDVFHAAVAWIDADRTNRLTFAADLIGCVRFVYITPDEIAKHVETKHFLFQGDEGKELLLCIYRHHALQTCGCQHGQRIHRLPRRKYKSVSSLPAQNQCNSAYNPALRSESENDIGTAPSCDVILSVGGVDPFVPEVELQARLVEQFHPQDNSWTTMTRLPDGRHHHGAALMDKAIYIIGGSVLDDLNPGHLCNPTASCYRYDIASGQWGAIAPLNTPRMYHATAVLNGVIYVIAGQTQHSRHLPSMECYRAEADEWEMGVEVSEGRIGVAVAAYRGQLFAVGGFLETQHEHVVRGTVEAFDPRARRWNSLNALPTPRCHAGLAECGGKLYLVGGSTFPVGSSTVCSLASILRYEELEDRWNRVQTLRIPRHDMGIAVLGCRIFIVGGVSSTENKVLSDVECYDVEGDYWLDDVEPIESPALGLVCLTIPADPEPIT